MNFCELWRWTCNSQPDIKQHNLPHSDQSSGSDIISACCAVERVHDSELFCRTDGSSNTLLLLTACCVLYIQSSCSLAVVTKYSACLVKCFFFLPLFISFQLCRGRFILFHLHYLLLEICFYSEYVLYKHNTCFTTCPLAFPCPKWYLHKREVRFHVNCLNMDVCSYTEVLFWKCTSILSNLICLTWQF